jgi:hypothetical protein
MLKVPNKNLDIRKQRVVLASFVGWHLPVVIIINLFSLFMTLEIDKLECFSLASII